MYHSKVEIERKLQQARYSLRQLTRFEGRVFVNNGLDEETGSNPLLLSFSTFVTETRSVFQYGFKEAVEHGMREVYEEYAGQRPIIRLFKNIRDDNIHQYMPGARTIVELSSPIKRIDPTTGSALGEPASVLIETLDVLDNPKASNTDANVWTIFLKRIDLSPELMAQWETEGRTDLIASARSGERLYEPLTLNGKNNGFALCRSYLECAEEFYTYGMSKGFIT